jgi:hypothetical protein
MLAFEPEGLDPAPQVRIAHQGVELLASRLCSRTALGGLVHEHDSMEPDGEAQLSERQSVCGRLAQVRLADIVLKAGEGRREHPYQELVVRGGPLSHELLQTIGICQQPADA